MTTIDAPRPGDLAGSPPVTGTPPVDNYLTWTKGVASWVFTLDHKRIGVMYLLGVLVSFLVGGIFALIIRTELIAPGQTIIEPETYNIMFTLHGAVMVFLVIIPSIPGSLGNFVLPIMLGAKDVAFPRLNLFSFHLWIIGAVFTVLALLFGGFDTGWTFYTPYSTK
ncbi:MAG: cbb3-type cytochrome c oxidase subunit I, partial [Planctomycetota bacterium]|nr:cbb3-type cytochrome c oxidase subunit I [Planctomycetota bacterium]